MELSDFLHKEEVYEVYDFLRRRLSDTRADTSCQSLEDDTPCQSLEDDTPSAKHFWQQIASYLFFFLSCYLLPVLAQ
jgi:hypothetical protein